jgi:hypothetical protein
VKREIEYMHPCSAEIKYLEERRCRSIVAGEPIVCLEKVEIIDAVY